MEHNIALNYLNEIKDACEALSQEDLYLIEIKTNIEYAVGYAILIRSFLNSVCKRKVSSIAEKYSLAVEEEREGTMIYEPKIVEHEL